MVPKTDSYSVEYQKLQKNILKITKNVKLLRNFKLVKKQVKIFPLDI